MSNRKNIELFKHNEEAYIALNILLNRYGKACIIHPTGSGKSIIAFRYIMDNPGKSVLWLSPSSNIYEIQKDALWWMLDGDVYESITDRIQYYTYCKLYRLVSNNSDPHADIIILDEFHRCGATTWYKGVKHLLSENRDSIVIGLTADSIRYFDNRRDMAKVLFDDNVASRITLIEAINRKILPCPRYVISECDSTLTDISETKMRSMDHARRMSGLNKMFEKYMKKTGRYIIFCSRYCQLDYVKENLSQWFGRIDKKPVVYVIKASDRNVLRTLRKFQDDDSSHLKLLLCVNLLNEGIHIYGLNGVVFFRHTISPTLYIQQLGRALLTGSDKQPVIFDIVRNYSNLTTFDSIFNHPSNISDNTSSDVSYENLLCNIEGLYRSVNGRKIISGVHNRISKTWETYYIEAKAYYILHGNLNIPADHKTESGLSLGRWLRTQKRIKAGVIKGGISIERQYLLENIGIEWYSNVEEAAIKKSNFIFDNYDLAVFCIKEYGLKYGHMCIHVAYTVNGFELGRWVKSVRDHVRRGSKRTFTKKTIEGAEQYRISVGLWR